MVDKLSPEIRRALLIIASREQVAFSVALELAVTEGIKVLLDEMPRNYGPVSKYG